MSHVICTSHVRGPVSVEEQFRKTVDSASRNDLVKVLKRFMIETKGSKGLNLQQAKNLEYLLENLYEVLPDGEFLVKVESMMIDLKEDIEKIENGLL